MNFSKRTDHLASAIFSQLETKKNQLLSQGREVFDFGTGTPDLPPAPHLIEILRDEVTRPENYRYAIKDLPELIEATISWYQRRFSVALKPDQVLALMGSQEGLAHIALTLVNPGETVLVPDPGYPIFNVGPLIADAVLSKMPLLPEKDFLINLEAIDPTIAHHAKMMIVSYPNNPVTALAPVEFYEKLVWFAKKYDIVVVHDNAYCELVFDGQKGGSFLSIPGAMEVGVEFNSLSKSYNIPGCRISFALGNSKVIERLRNLKSHLDYGVFLPIQKTAIAAITGPQDSLRHTVQTYENRRNLFIERLAEVGWKIPKPPATMFIWAPIPNSYSSSLTFTFDLLEKTGVIVVPGSSFGERGEGFVRLAMVQPEERIKKAIRAIQASGIIFS